MRWWGWWRSDAEDVAKAVAELEPVESSERRRASVTAELDAVIQQVRTESAAATQEVRVASRKATNASRRVIGRTGQWQAVDIPKPEKP